MTPYHRQILCEVYNNNMKKFVKNCGLSRTRMPQLRDLDQYLESESGFRLKVVNGLLSQRDFFYALAHKVTGLLLHSIHPSQIRPVLQSRPGHDPRDNRSYGDVFRSFVREDGSRIRTLVLGGQ